VEDSMGTELTSHKHNVAIKNVGVLTSGGDAPGMNAAIRAVVRTARYFGINVYGIQKGYSGLLKEEMTPLDDSSVDNLSQRGGTILQSDRCLEFMEKDGRNRAYEFIKKTNIDGLIAIGGNGTFTGAHKLWEEFQLPVIGVPGTIDNDIFGTDVTIGFDTAANTAMLAIDKIKDTASSHRRVFVIEVMGRNTGYLAMDVGLGVEADVILLPEKKKNIDDIAAKIDKKAKESGFNSSTIVVMAEGETSGLCNDVGRVLKDKYKLDTRVCILGHIQRGGAPTTRDRKIASIMGAMAVRDLRDGFTDIMVGISGWSPVRTPLLDAISKRKEMHNDLFLLADIMTL